MIDNSYYSQDVHGPYELHDIGIDHPEVGFVAKLASKQPNRFLIGIDVVGATGDETRDEHPLERRHVEFGRDRCFDRNLVNRRATTRCRGADDGETGEREPSVCPSAEPRGH